MRYGHVLLVSLALALVTGCASAPTNGPDGPDRTDTCSGKGMKGNPVNTSPVVCVSVWGDRDGWGGLIVHPMEVHVSHRGKGRVRWETNVPVGELVVKMKDEGCLANRQCTGKGQASCENPAAPTAKKDDRCRYEVIVTTVRGSKLTLDPIVIVDTNGP